MICLCGICNSRVSSIVIILSCCGINDDIVLSVVVFPQPVPPAIIMLDGLICNPSITIQRNAAKFNVKVFLFIKSKIV